MSNLLRKKLDILRASLSSKRKYYCELEYLRSTGTQYIDTGIIGTQDTSVELIIKATATDTKIFGSRTSTSENNITVFYGYSGTPPLLGIDFNNSNYESYRCQGDAINKVIKVTLNKTERIIKNLDGTVIASESTPCTDTITTPSTLWLGDIYQGYQHNLFTGEIYSCKIWNNSTLVRDFIPVLDWNYVPCLYDKVTGQLFYNQGTGEFLYGREIHEVEYIESTGTQYIDTGVSTNDVTSTYCKFAGTFGLTYSGKIYSGQCFGSRISTTNNAFYYANGVTNDSVGNGNSIVSITRNANTDFSEITYSKTNYEVTGTSYSQIGSLEVGNITSNFNFYLFGINDNGSANLGTWKYSSFKLYTSSGLTRDFIPIVDENFNGYLFDKVNRKIYENAGTGSFVVPDIEVEYIESTGTEYIDTGLSGYTTFRGTAECTANSSKSQVLIGDSSGGGHFLASRISSTLKWGTSTTTTAAYTNVDTMSKADFEVNFDNGSTHGYVNNDPFTYSLTASFSTFTIFKNATGNSYPFYGRLFSLEAYQNNTLVKNLIPVIHNGVACFKNTINNTYLTNAGTGDFVVGKIKEKV